MSAVYLPRWCPLVHRFDDLIVSRTTVLKGALDSRCMARPKVHTTNAACMAAHCIHRAAALALFGECSELTPQQSTN
eukprot:3218398-Amphidinium_carterae.1